MRAFRADPASRVEPAVVEIDPPVRAAGELLIEVAYAGLSFADWLRARGEYQESTDGPFTVGGELSGRVLESPTGSGFAHGDRVAAIVGTGAAADLAVLPAERAFRVPERVSHRTAAAAMLNFLTARFALVDRGRLRAGEEVLVLGAGGGLGGAAVAVARRAGARSVVAVAASPAKRAVAMEMGAHRAIAPADLLVTAPTFDLVVDPVGGSFAHDAVRALRDGGRHLILGFASGEITAVRLNRALYRNLEHIGAGWGTHAAVDPDGVNRSWASLAQDLAEGDLVPYVGAEGPLEDAPALLNALGRRSARGKTVICVSDKIM